MFVSFYFSEIGATGVRNQEVTDLLRRRRRPGRFNFVSFFITLARNSDIFE